MKLTKLLTDSILIEDDGQYLVVMTKPLRAVKISSKQYNIITGVKTLIQDLLNKK